MTDPLPDVEALLAKWDETFECCDGAPEQDKEIHRPDCPYLVLRALCVDLQRLREEKQYWTTGLRAAESQVQQLQEENARLKDEKDHEWKMGNHYHEKWMEAQAEVERLTAERAGGQATPEEKDNAGLPR